MKPEDVPPSLPWESEEGWSESYTRMLQGCKSIPTTNPAKLSQALENMRRGEVDFNELPLPTGVNRKISVPLQKLDKCGVCEKTTTLRLCSSCASAIYCSRECQKFDWRLHKPVCSETQQINLKVFYPIIAYMFDSLRRLSPSPQETASSPNMNPFIKGVFENLGMNRRLAAHDPDTLHPALRHRILKAPKPGSRKATPSENTVHHTVVLGEKYDLQISTAPDARKLAHWWRGRPTMAGMHMFLHAIRESHIFEVTIAVSLILLSEVYSTYMAKSPKDPDVSWERRGCFRLEYGHSPVSDFGICRGRIEGKASRLQTWTYYESKVNTRTDVLDPNNHYWLYFRTIKGEELFLDCCSFPYGMEGCVDATPCLKDLSSLFRDYGSARTPGCLFAPQRPEECPNSHSLIEEHRFSVMQNKSLYGALGWELFGGQREEQHSIMRDFMTRVQGKPCTSDQEERVRDYRSFGSMMLGQVLTGKLWKGWGKPTVYSRDDCFEGSGKESEWVKGSKEDPECGDGKLNGLLGLFSDVLGIK